MISTNHAVSQTCFVARVRGNRAHYASTRTMLGLKVWYKHMQSQMGVETWVVIGSVGVVVTSSFLMGRVAAHASFWSPYPRAINVKDLYPQNRTKLSAQPFTQMFVSAISSTICRTVVVCFTLCPLSTHSNYTLVGWMDYCMIYKISRYDKACT